MHNPQDYEGHLTTHPFVAKICLKCLHELMSVAKQNLKMAVSSNWRMMVPLRTLIKSERSLDHVKVEDMEVNTVPIS